MKRGRIYNKIYTPELWEQVNPNNKALLEDFLAEYRQRKKAKSTIDAYFQDGRYILIYVLQQLGNRSLLELKKKDFRGMSLWFSEEKQMSSARVNRLNELYQVKKQGLTEGNKTNVVVGKRGKKFPLVYLDDTRDLIAKYLEQRGDDDIESLWVKIVGDTKTEITKDCLYNRMVSISNIFSQVRGEPCNIFCHTMRHSRAECLKQGTDTRLLDENGKPKVFTIDQISKALHHSDISTTQGYLMNHDEEEIDAMFGLV